MKPVLLFFFVCSHYYPDWFLYEWSEYHVRGERKGPIPPGFNVAKGSTHMAVTREFVQFAVNDSRARDLLYYMRNIKIPDEHFFQTLNHNPQMDIPGAYIGQYIQVIPTQLSLTYRPSEIPLFVTSSAFSEFGGFSIAKQLKAQPQSGVQ